MQIWELAGILDKRSRSIADTHYFNLLSTFAAKLPPEEVGRLVDLEVESIKRLDRETNHEPAIHQN